MSLRRRLALLFVSYLALVGVATAATLWATARRDDALARRGKFDVAYGDALALTAAYVDEETGERGYLLTGEEIFLEPYAAGRAADIRLTAHLVESLQGGGLAADLQAVADAADEWHTNASEPEIALRRSGAVEEALAKVATGEGRRLFDRLRDRLDAFSTRVAAKAEQSEADVTHWRSVLGVILAATLGAALFLTLLAAILLRRWVTKPLAQLAAAVRDVRSGALGEPVHASGPREVVELAADVEEMRVRLNRELDEVERAREGLVQNASVLLSVRARLESKVGALPAGWTLAAELRPAAGVVAGDCYEVNLVAPGQLGGLVLVDVAGHGADSAVLALRVKELLRAALRSPAAVGEAVAWASQQLDDLDPDMFVSAFAARLDTATGACRYANAGHPPPLLIARAAAVELDPTGPIIGPFAGTWATGDATIEPGSVLVMYTDGIVERRDAAHQQFGRQRLHHLVHGATDEEASEILARCLEAVDSFGPNAADDDVTIVVVARAGNAAAAVSPPGSGPPSQ